MKKQLPSVVFLTAPGIQSQVPVVVLRKAPDLQLVQAVGSLGALQVAQVMSHSSTTHRPSGDMTLPGGQTQGPEVVLKTPVQFTGNALLHTSLTCLTINVANGSLQDVQ